MATKRRKRENGTGTAFQRKGQLTWTAECTLGYDEWGKRIVTRKSGFKSRLEALEYIPTLRKEAEKKKTEKTLEFHPVYQATAQNFTTVRECFENYMRRSEDRMGTNTIRTYRTLFKACLEDIAHVPVVIMQPMDWQRLIDKLKKDGKSSATRSAVLSIIHKVNKQAMLEGIIDTDKSAAVEVGKRDRKLYHVALTPDEVKQHLEIARSGDYVAKVACVMMFTGMRASELMDMTPGQYNKDGRYFVGGMKTAAGTNRIIPVSDVVVPFVNDMLVRNHFKTRITGFTYTQWKHHLDDFYSAHPELVRHTSHDFRRTFATMMKTVNAPDADKMAIIGHANIEMTQYYQDSRADELRAVVNGLWQG